MSDLLLNLLNAQVVPMTAEDEAIYAGLRKNPPVVIDVPDDTPKNHHLSEGALSTQINALTNGNFDRIFGNL